MSNKNCQKLKNFFWSKAELAKETFIIFAVVFFIFLIIEDIKPGFVLNYFNLKLFFFICLGTGIAALILAREKPDS